MPIRPLLLVLLPCLRVVLKHHKTSGRWRGNFGFCRSSKMGKAVSRALRENATRGALTAEQPQLLPVLLSPSSVIVDTLASRYGRRSSLNFTTTGWIRHVSLPPHDSVQISSNNFPPFTSLNPIFFISARPAASLLVPLHSITPPTVIVSS